MERLITELTDRDGVDSIYRYGPEALVVDAPNWDETRLKMWLHRHNRISRLPPHAGRPYGGASPP